MQSTYTIVGLGELLWDEFPDNRRLGGAPANVAYHASVLGDHGVLATRVGSDAAGDEALNLLASRGVDVGHVQRDPLRPTGVARIRLDADGEPAFSFDMQAAWTAPTWSDGWCDLLRRADVLCFGTLICSGAAGRAVLQQAAQTVPPGAFRLLDLNLRPPYTPDAAVEASLSCANALKLSEEEARLLARKLGVDDVAPHLIRQRGFRLVAVTRGARGSVMYTATGRHEHPGLPLMVDGPHDAVGAGDAFTAALAHHLVRDHGLPRTSAAANRYAALVAARAGAMPEIPQALRNEVTGEP